MPSVKKRYYKVNDVNYLVEVQTIADFVIFFAVLIITFLYLQADHANDKDQCDNQPENILKLGLCFFLGIFLASFGCRIPNVFFCQLGKAHYISKLVNSFIVANHSLLLHYSSLMIYLSCGDKLSVTIRAPPSPLL